MLGRGRKAKSIVEEETIWASMDYFFNEQYIQLLKFFIAKN